MVLHTRGRVGRRHFTTSLETRKRLGALFFKRPFSFEKWYFPSQVPSQVLDQAKACLETPATLHNYRNRVAELLPRLSLQLRGVSREKPDLFHSGATDLPIVKRIKEIANRIILQKHSLMHGALMLLYFSSVMCSGYLGNRSSASLRESFRNDLHQLLAYTAFSTEKKKHCVLVAPFSRFERSKMKYRSAFSDATIEISCLGIPFSVSSLSEIVDQLSKWCQSLT